MKGIIMSYLFTIIINLISLVFNSTYFIIKFNMTHAQGQISHFTPSTQLYPPLSQIHPNQVLFNPPY